jgi:hypothetical protein
VGDDEENHENVGNVMAAYLVRRRNRTGSLRKSVPAHCYSVTLLVCSVTKSAFYTGLGSAEAVSAAQNENHALQYCDGFAQSMKLWRQGIPLLGKHARNTHAANNTKEEVFSMWSVPRLFARQLSHVSTTTRKTVFSML